MAKLSVISLKCLDVYMYVVWWWFFYSGISLLRAQSLRHQSSTLTIYATIKDKPNFNQLSLSLDEAHCPSKLQYCIPIFTVVKHSLPLTCLYLEQDITAPGQYSWTCFGYQTMQVLFTIDNSDVIKYSVPFHSFLLLGYNFKINMLIMAQTDQRFRYMMCNGWPIFKNTRT